ncbi:MAG: Fe(3+)-hydroxamate ABC transporter permease FhuB, partial [Marinobacter sp.]
MYASTSGMPASRPVMAVRLPIAATLPWLGALLASAVPWLNQLDAATVLSSFWAFNPNNYSSVLAHFSWAPRVSIAILIGCGLGLA